MNSTELSEPERDAMVQALALARRAGEQGEVPVGAVVLLDGHVIAARHNERESSADPTAHAEVLALRDAAEALGQWRLREATLVVTLEPCLMCAGAIWAAQVAKVVFGAPDIKAGAMGSLYNFAVDTRLNHQSEVVAGIQANEAADLMSAFFVERR